MHEFTEGYDMGSRKSIGMVLGVGTSVSLARLIR